MTRRRSRPSEADPGFQMAPMVDVVFQLLIFFMCSSSLRPPEGTVQLEQAAPGTPTAETLAVQIEIGVDRGGKIRFNGLELGVAPVAAAELERRLRELSGRFGSDQVVLIRADRAVPYQGVMDVLAACARAGAVDVAIAAGPRGP